MCGETDTDEAIDEEMMEVLDQLLVERYTKWTKVLGKGRTSGPHLLTHVWPKANNVLAVCTEDERANKLLEGMRELRKELGREGVKAFCVPILECT